MEWKPRSGSVAEPEPPGAATFKAAPEPIFFYNGAGAAFF